MYLSVHDRGVTTFWRHTGRGNQKELHRNTTRLQSTAGWSTWQEEHHPRHTCHQLARRLRQIQECNKRHGEKVLQHHRLSFRQPKVSARVPLTDQQFLQHLSQAFNQRPSQDQGLRQNIRSGRQWLRRSQPPQWKNIRASQPRQRNVERLAHPAE